MFIKLNADRNGETGIIEFGILKWTYIAKLGSDPSFFPGMPQEVTFFRKFGNVNTRVRQTWYH